MFLDHELEEYLSSVAEECRDSVVSLDARGALEESSLDQWLDLLESVNEGLGYW